MTIKNQKGSSKNISPIKNNQAPIVVNNKNNPPKIIKNTTTIKPPPTEKVYKSITNLTKKN